MGFISPARLIIFDLDGTLLNTIDDLATSTNHALQYYGYPQHDFSEYPFFVGNGITKLIERALPAEVRTNEIITKVQEEFVRYYQKHKTDFTFIYPGISELLNILHKGGCKLAVASNKYHQGTVELINHFFEEQLFDIVLGQRENIPTKPDPQIVYEILQQTETNPEQTLYVGDSGVDMQTARNSGITSIGVSWGFRPKEELIQNNACHIANKAADIANIAGISLMPIP